MPVLTKVRSATTRSSAPLAGFSGTCFSSKSSSSQCSTSNGAVVNTPTAVKNSSTFNTACRASADGAPTATCTSVRAASNCTRRSSTGGGPPSTRSVAANPSSLATAISLATPLLFANVSLASDTDSRIFSRPTAPNCSRADGSSSMTSSAGPSVFQCARATASRFSRAMHRFRRAARHMSAAWTCAVDRHSSVSMASTPTNASTTGPNVPSMIAAHAASPRQTFDSSAKLDICRRASSPASRMSGRSSRHTSSPNMCLATRSSALNTDATCIRPARPSRCIVPAGGAPSAPSGELTAFATRLSHSMPPSAWYVSYDAALASELSSFCASSAASSTSSSSACLPPWSPACAATCAANAGGSLPFFLTRGPASTMSARAHGNPCAWTTRAARSCDTLSSPSDTSIRSSASSSTCASLSSSGLPVSRFTACVGTPRSSSVSQNGPSKSASAVAHATRRPGCARTLAISCETSVSSATRDARTSSCTVAALARAAAAVRTVASSGDDRHPSRRGMLPTSRKKAAAGEQSKHRLPMQRAAAPASAWRWPVVASTNASATSLATPHSKKGRRTSSERARSPIIASTVRRLSSAVDVRSNLMSEAARSRGVGDIVGRTRKRRTPPSSGSVSTSRSSTSAAADTSASGTVATRCNVLFSAVMPSSALRIPSFALAIMASARASPSTMRRTPPCRDTNWPATAYAFAPSL
mmetsp:Transcript_16114/g.50392  ORF Transcript_16114/g.50392 Transcript_16114/m.50392 type:complete len:702 (-) Transcript_16114:512-2617(-)